MFCFKMTTLNFDKLNIKFMSPTCYYYTTYRKLSHKAINTACYKIGFSNFVFLNSF